jgi:hypothetical protein
MKMLGVVDLPEEAVELLLIHDREKLFEIVHVATRLVAMPFEVSAHPVHTPVISSLLGVMLRPSA